MVAFVECIIAQTMHTVKRSVHNRCKERAQKNPPGRVWAWLMVFGLFGQGGQEVFGGTEYAGAGALDHGVGQGIRRIPSLSEVRA